MKNLLFNALGAVCAAAILSSTAAAQQPETTPAQTTAVAEPIKDVRVVLHTDKGDIAATLFATQAPVTVANFLNLAAHKFYDGLTFHRVIAGFMIQGGDPQGSGAGGPGYTFEDEFRPSLRFDKPGIFAMANRGPSTNGSQFFITHDATPHLNDRHTIFGQVTQGQDIVTGITRGDHIKSIEILDSYKSLFDKEADRLKEWNASIEKQDKKQPESPKPQQ